jgi:thimet oligopeptidase
MLKQSTLALFLVAACGGAKPNPAPAPAPAPASEPPARRPRPEAGPMATKVAPASKGDLFLAECRAELQTGKSRIEAVRLVTAPRTVENTLAAYDDGAMHLANAGMMSSFYHEVDPDAGVRDASRTCEQEVQQVSTALALDRALYDAIKAVDVSKADAATQRYQRNLLRDFRRAGVDLPEPQRARIKEIEDELTKLGQQHAENIASDVRYIEVDDKAQLAGMPADWIAAHPPQANGKIRITTDYPDYFPFMDYADNDALRKALYMQYDNRASTTNEPILQRILVLRAEKAKLLGFRDWADYQSDDKMLRGGKAEGAFIDRVAKLARPRANKDLKELLAQLKKIDPKAKTVGIWQKYYLSEKVKQAAYAVDSAEVRQYFAFDNVLAGLLAITSEIYDVQYQPVTGAKAWDPSVKVYDVMRAGTKLGRIFLDLHPRDNKYKHAAQFPLKNGVLGKQLPEGALVCNFSTGLMDHDQVVVMFHEFGHLMHHTLGGQQRWSTQSGVATEWDFVEAPSQMFEEWAWSYDTLSRFAKRQDGTVIPKELVAKLAKARTFGLGIDTMRQMYFAALSLRYHQLDPAKLDQLAVAKQLSKQYMPYPYVDGTKTYTAFGHLVGYSSMYYTYMWSLAISKDLLTPFAKTGLMALPVTHKYRDTILVPGGTKDAADLVKDFLGRPYNFKAFEKYLKS